MSDERALKAILRPVPHDDPNATGAAGEQHFGGLVCQMGFRWQALGEKQEGIDGYIEVRRRRRSTGLSVAVQIKSGASHVRRETETEWVLRVEKSAQEYWARLRVPVLLVWFNGARDFYWTEVTDLDEERQIRVPKRSLLRLHIRGDLYRAKGAIYRIANRQAPHYDLLDATERSPRIAVSAVKAQARNLYNSRRPQCMSPVFGPVDVTLRAWRHLTATCRSQDSIVHRLRLLPAAFMVIESVDRFHVCRRIPGTAAAPTRVLYRQTARVRMPHRNDATVSVITERIGGGRVKFLSVYEEEPENKRSGGS